MADENKGAGVRFPPPFIYLGFLLAGLALEYAFPLSFGLNRLLLAFVGALLVLAGLGVGLPAMGLFRKAGTTPEPWTPTTAIVTTGVYRLTRNPMYLGMALIHAGFALAFDSPAALLLLVPAIVIVQTQVIAREERYLAATFGEPYEAYRRRVRRWI